LRGKNINTYPICRIALSIPFHDMEQKTDAHQIQENSHAKAPIPRNRKIRRKTKLTLQNSRGILP